MMRITFCRRLCEHPPTQEERWVSLPTECPVQAGGGCSGLKIFLLHTCCERVCWMRTYVWQLRKHGTHTCTILLLNRHKAFTFGLYPLSTSCVVQAPLVGQSAKRGAWPALYAATAPELSGVLCMLSYCAVLCMLPS